MPRAFAVARYPATHLELTDRESDVAALVAKGWTNNEVAAELLVSVNTVEYHLRKSFASLASADVGELRTSLSSCPDAQ